MTQTGNYKIEYLEAKKRRKIIARQAFWHKVHSLFNPFTWLRSLAQKRAENLQKGNNTDLTKKVVEASIIIARLKEQKKQLIFAINNCEDKVTRKEMNQLLNKIDAQLRVL
jgi:hypothetical protein